MEMPLDQQSAEKAMKHMIYTQLFMEGFDGAQASAVDLLFKEVVGYMQSLYQSTQEYGVQAGRSAPNAQDFVAACAERGITPKTLKSKRKPVQPENIQTEEGEARVEPTPRRRKRKRRGFQPRHANLIPRDLSSPEPELLQSEDLPHVPLTLRAFHNAPYLPTYPPKHTYIRSPPSPPQRASTTAILEKRMQNTAKVRAALKNLMDAADKKEEENPPVSQDGMADGEVKPPPPKLTNASLVNWQESFTLTRKRWKVGR
ncbi:hypothetical protein CPB86DRAFT_785231 [Serendipita vermifera]|nr:hypothetical protein CPB86DRAFT_785231 [Serendipita vermifera]